MFVTHTCSRVLCVSHTFLFACFVFSRVVCVSHILVHVFCAFTCFVCQSQTYCWGCTYDWQTHMRMRTNINILMGMHIWLTDTYVHVHQYRYTGWDAHVLLSDNVFHVLCARVSRTCSLCPSLKNMFFVPDDLCARSDFSYIYIYIYIYMHIYIYTHTQTHGIHTRK